jgi:uncharacterized protein
MKHYLLIYDLVHDHVERRGAYRNEHLQKAWAASDRGALVMAGALEDPTDGAMLVFQGDSPAVAEEFARDDPYVLNGLVTRWRVRTWNTVVGPAAANPVRPAGAKP